MSSLMTSPSSSAPASEWSVNQVKKLSGSSCCLFFPALFGVCPVRFVRSCIIHNWLIDIQNRNSISLKLTHKNCYPPFQSSIWVQWTLKTGHHSHSSGTLLRGLYSQSMDFHQSTGENIKLQVRQFSCALLLNLTRRKKVEIIYLQNLFCNLIWCPQTLWPPLWSGNEVLLHPPHRARLRLLVKSKTIY